MNIDLKAIEQAHARIKPHIHRTPVFTSSSINELSGCSIYFKCENFQKIGAFKIRGGMNASLQLSPGQLSRGLATHSSGNHAQAIAYAARQLGTKAYIVMPETSPEVKINAVRGYGAQIRFCKPTQEAREEALRQIIDETGAEFIHPYDDDRVITGQATCARELIGEIGEFDALITPVGGGGLLSGTSLATKYLLPNAAVYAGEPEGAADAVLSLKSKKVERAPFVNTIADGLLTSLSERTLAIITQHVTDIFLVSDEEIKSALRLIYERMKIVIEPSSAVPFAALMRNKEKFRNKKVGIILTGGNVDLGRLKQWF